MKDYRFARIACEAYRAKSGGKSLATGQPIPEFDQLSVEIKDAWASSAAAVLTSAGALLVAAAEDESPAVGNAVSAAALAEGAI